MKMGMSIRVFRILRHLDDLKLLALIAVGHRQLCLSDSADGNAGTGHHRANIQGRTPTSTYR